MANVVRKTLNELSTDLVNIVVTGVILSKTDPNIFQPKDSNEHRSVVLFTIRDSKRYIANCKCWGSKEKIEEYHRMLNVYDVIDIIGPRVIPIRDNQLEQQFQPIVTIPFQLVLNEGVGFIEKHIGELKDMTVLCRLSIRSLSSVLNLADINSTNVNFKGHYVDLLVVIGLVKPVKDVRAKSGYPLKCLELIVIDKSLASGMVLTIWNTGWIDRSQHYWKPLKTVLHLIDVRVGYSEFYKRTTLGLCSRSLVFENPIGKEMEQMAKYIASAPTIDMDLFARDTRESLPDPNTIRSLMTVKQIYDHTGVIPADDSEEFTAVLLAAVTKFDIDGHSSVIARKCKSCGQRMLRDDQICGNEQCQMSFSFNYSGDKFEQFIDINIQLGDHTGTLIEARLSGSVAEKVLRLTTEEFIRKNDQQKEILKWQFLLERYEVKLFIKKATLTRQKLFVQVVDMQKLDLEEFSKRISVY